MRLLSEKLFIVPTNYTDKALNDPAAHGNCRILKDNAVPDTTPVLPKNRPLWWQQGWRQIYVVHSLHQNGPLPIHLPHHILLIPMATTVAELHAVADTTYLPTYTDPLQLAQAMQVCWFAYVWD